MPGIVEAYGKKVYLSDQDIEELGYDKLAMQMYAELTIECKEKGIPLEWSVSVPEHPGPSSPGS